VARAASPQGSRAAGLGLDAATAYVQTHLQQSNYWPSYVPVTVATHTLTAAPVLNASWPDDAGGARIVWVAGRHYEVARFSGSGTVFGRAVSLSADACVPTTVPPATAPSDVAVVPRYVCAGGCGGRVAPPDAGITRSNGCALRVQVAALAAAGYSAVLLVGPAPFAFSATLRTSMLRALWPSMASHS
jgi:hypothetical protein